MSANSFRSFTASTAIGGLGSEARVPDLQGSDFDL
jgi:hypothetical protein